MYARNDISQLATLIIASHQVEMAKHKFTKVATTKLWKNDREYL